MVNTEIIHTIYVMLCTIWYHSHHLKNVKNTQGGVFLLVKLQAEACNLNNKSNTPPWAFLMFFKLCQIAQSVSYGIGLPSNDPCVILKDHLFQAAMTHF